LFQGFHQLTKLEVRIAFVALHNSIIMSCLLDLSVQWPRRYAIVDRLSFIAVVNDRAQFRAPFNTWRVAAHVHVIDRANHFEWQPLSNRVR
jgi:hypothetical protein